MSGNILAGVTIGQRQRDARWYTCKLQESLAMQHIPRSAERLGPERVQDAAVDLMIHGW